jgi:hypothetical protein
MATDELRWRRVGRTLLLETERGLVEIRLREPELLGRWPYRIVVRDRHGFLVDSVEGFEKLSWTKALAEDLVRANLA